MSLPVDQVVRQQRFIREHPEWSIHCQDGARRFIAEKGDSPDATLLRPCRSGNCSTGSMRSWRPNDPITDWFHAA